MLCDLGSDIVYRHCKKDVKCCIIQHYFQCYWIIYSFLSRLLIYCDVCWHCVFYCVFLIITASETLDCYKIVTVNLLQNLLNPHAYNPLLHYSHLQFYMPCILLHILFIFNVYNSRTWCPCTCFQPWCLSNGSATSFNYGFSCDITACKIIIIINQYFPCFWTISTHLSNHPFIAINNILQGGRIRSYSSHCE